MENLNSLFKIFLPAAIPFKLWSSRYSRRIWQWSPENNHPQQQKRKLIFSPPATYLAMNCGQHDLCLLCCIHSREKITALFMRQRGASVFLACTSQEEKVWPVRVSALPFSEKENQKSCIYIPAKASALIPSNRAKIRKFLKCCIDTIHQIFLNYRLEYS